MGHSILFIASSNMQRFDYLFFIPGPIFTWGNRNCWRLCSADGAAVFGRLLAEGVAMRVEADVCGGAGGRVITLPWTTTWPAGFHAFHVPELLKYPRLPSRSLLHTNPHPSAHNVHQAFYPTRPHPPRLSLRRLRSAMVPFTRLPEPCPGAHPHTPPATPLRTALRLLHAAVSFPNSTTCQPRVLTFRPFLFL